MKIRINRGHIKLFIKGRKGFYYLERILIALLLVAILLITLFNLIFNRQEVKQTVEVAKTVNIAASMPEPIIIEEPTPTIISKPYRLTSYYTGDATNSTHITGSGLTTKSFAINSKGWYTYKGKLVIAAATEELLNSNEFLDDKAMHTRVEGRHYFRYFDEITITIDGIIYEAIVLDSCGASMKVNEDRIDLFVSSSYNKIDRGYNGVNPITILMEVR